eukprot:g7263.t1
MLSDGFYADLLEKKRRALDEEAANGKREGSNTLWSTVPYAEPSTLQGHASPYYGEAHLRWRRRCRAFVDEHLTPYAAEWDEAGAPPEDLPARMYAAGMLAVIWPAEHGGTPPAGSEGAWAGAWRGTRVDPFFDMIHMDELARCGSGGLLASIFSFGIALPPVLAHGSEELVRRVCRPVITGEKVMCLAVTEPGGGSDVARLTTTAELSADGSHYLVRGSKKWITNGVRADFFTVVVRTGGEGSGAAGLSLLLLERGMPGITCRRMRTQGWWASNTAYITLEDVRVPAANLIGVEGAGFAYTMENFNHERFMLAVQMNRFARLCVEEAVSFARRRRTFGRRLVEHQAIRHKVVEMVRRVESTHALLEHYAFQVRSGLPDARLYGFMAWLKVQASKTMEYAAREASQVLGGASFTREGAGAVVERVYREVRVMAIGGGSEEVMLDLAMKHAKL